MHFDPFHITTYSYDGVYDQKEDSVQPRQTENLMALQSMDPTNVCMYVLPHISTMYMLARMSMYICEGLETMTWHYLNGRSSG